MRTPKSDALRLDLLRARCQNWGLFADIQYREFYGIRQKVPTAIEYMTAIRAKGAFR